VHAILQSENAGVEAQIFAATTLKGKVCWLEGTLMTGIDRANYLLSSLP